MTPYYEHNGITIYHGDCRQVPLDIDVVILTDPPYGTGQNIAYDVYKDTIGEWLEIMEWLLGFTFPMAFTMSHTRLFDLPKRPQWLGCWDKVFTGGITHVGASPTWEPICFYNLPAGDRGKERWDDIFRYTPAGFPFNIARDPNGHPCPKPVDLYKRLLRVLPNDVVFDPMMGSGTTLVAAKSVGRKAIGIDLSERYCEIAAKRLAQDVLPLDSDPINEPSPMQLSRVE
jgi:site-specific DNA-methyltransferase (adenine-specific)